MSSLSPRKRLRAVAHDLAHHAVSALSFLHPELRRAQPEGDRIAIDLLADDPSPNSPASHAANALRVKFGTILERVQVERSALESASATFFYRGDEEWPYACHVQLELRSGDVVEDAVGADGNRANILRRTPPS